MIYSLDEINNDDILHQKKFSGNINKEIEKYIFDVLENCNDNKNNKLLEAIQILHTMYKSLGKYNERTMLHILLNEITPKSIILRIMQQFNECHRVNHDNINVGNIIQVCDGIDSFYFKIKHKTKKTLIGNRLTRKITIKDMKKTFHIYDSNMLCDKHTKFSYGALLLNITSIPGTDTILNVKVDENVKWTVIKSLFFDFIV
jgi:hypothetical protein